MSTQRVTRDGSWRARPTGAALVGLAMVVGPALGGLAVALIAARLLGEPEGILADLLWWVAIIAASFAGSVLAERGTRRLAPLRTLLRTSLEFPSRPPSRIHLAARRSSATQLLGRLQEARVDAGALADAESVTRTLILVTALQAHDPATRGHAERVRMLVDLLTAEMGIGDPDRDRIRWAALLHDLGKLDLPPALLHKAEPLEDEEWDAIRGHPERGMALTEPLHGWLGVHASGIGQHHERFDGTGYPMGLAGTEIGLAARIVAVVDAFEVMTGPREYRERLTVAEAEEELAANAGTQFDPAIVRAFLNLSARRLAAVAGILSSLGAVALVRQPPAFAAAASAAALTVTAAVMGVGGLARGPATPVGVVEARTDVVPDPVGGAPDAADDPTAPRTDDPGDVPSPRPTGAPDQPVASDATPLSSFGSPSGTAAGADADAPTSVAGGAGNAPGGGGGSSPTAGGSGGGTSQGAPATAEGTAAAPGPPAGQPTPAPADDDDGTDASDAGAGSAAPRPTVEEDTPSAAQPVPRPTTAAAGSPPTAVDDAYTVQRRTTTFLDVLANDIDPDGDLDPSTLRIVEDAQHGEAVAEPDGRVRLETQPGYRGDDQFTYEVCDLEGTCAAATVHLEIIE